MNDPTEKTEATAQTPIAEQGEEAWRRDEELYRRLLLQVLQRRSRRTRTFVQYAAQCGR